MDNRAQVREFLASRRARITPDQAGLPAYGGNRRVKGLRREEVALLAGVSIVDISGILSTIRVPTLVIHRTDDVTIDVEGGRYLAEHIPGARYVELPGTDHIPFVDHNAMEIADLIGEFLTGSRTPVAADTVLATVLFTDIVGSTEKAYPSATAGGATCLTTITPSSGVICSVSGAARSTPPATASWPPSTVRRAVSAAPARLPTTSDRSGSTSAPGCIPASAKSWTTRSAASPFTSAPASRRSRAQAKSWCRAP
jgi:hypothetical protein